VVRKGAGDRALSFALTAPKVEADSISFRTRANKSAAQANVRATVPGMEAFNADHATGYVGVNLAKLQGSYDAGIKNVTIRAASQGGYCIENTLPGTVTYHKSGPSGDIKSGSC
jgi:hypothetical protein